MTREELIGFLLVTAILVLSLPLMKLLGFIGRKIGLWKPYFRMKGQRYGSSNTRETRSGKKLPVVMWETLKAFLLLLGPLVILTILPEVKVLRSVLSIIAATAGIHTFYMAGQMANCTCIYCSTSKKEVEQFIEKISEKNQFFKSQITEIQYEDGWYMIFIKKYEECRKAMLEHPNFYVRECPKKLKRLSSFWWILLYALPGLLVAGGIYYVGSKFLGIHEDILQIAMVIPQGPFLYYIFKVKNDIFKECKTRFREEENLPEDKYKVNVRYSSAEGGRLIFTVKPIDENEGELK